MKIRNAESNDITSIVSIHQAAFPEFFLTKLGGLFLSELYMSYIKYDDGILRVLVNSDGKPVGFAAGALRPDEFYTILKKERWFSFLYKMLPYSFSHPVVIAKKIWYAITYKGEKPSIEDNFALLSSIGIYPEYSGKALGRKMIDDFESQVRICGLSNVYLTTDKYANDKVVGFYLRCGYKLHSEFVQSAGRVMFKFVKEI